MGTKLRLIGRIHKVCSADAYNYVSLHIEEPNLDCKAFMKLGFKEDKFLPILKLKESIEEYESRKRV